MAAGMSRARAWKHSCSLQRLRSDSSARVWALGVAEAPVGASTRCSVYMFVLLFKSARCHEVMRGDPQQAEQSSQQDSLALLWHDALWLASLASLGMDTVCKIHREV